MTDRPQGLGALTDLKVVELGVWVAAPSTAALLADWGADVVKVEPPTGDPMRNVFGSLGIASEMPNPACELAPDSIVGTTGSGASSGHSR